MTTNPPISAIPELRRRMAGTVPRHGAKDPEIPHLTQVAILAKQVCNYLKLYGRWPA